MRDPIPPLHHESAKISSGRVGPGLAQLDLAQPGLARTKVSVGVEA